MKIDVHNHILPESWPDLRKKYGYGEWVALKHDTNEDKEYADMYQNEKFFRKVHRNCWCPETRIKEMDNTGVDVQVLSTVPVMFSYWAQPKDTLDLCKMLNNHLTSLIKKYPKRFLGLATLPMQEPELAITEMERSITELGLSGVIIGSHINEWNLDAVELLPFFKAAENLGVAIFVHPWDMELCGRMSKYWLPWLVGMPAETCTAIVSLLFGGVLEKCPKLKICFAHGAGSFPFTIGRIEHGFNVRPDLCAVDNNVNPRNYLGKIYADSLVHDENALDLLVATIGKDRVVLGSDYPFPLGEHVPGKLIEEHPLLDRETKIHSSMTKTPNICIKKAPAVNWLVGECLLWKNALEFLGIKKDHPILQSD